MFSFGLVVRLPAGLQAVADTEPAEADAPVESAAIGVVEIRVQSVLPVVAAVAMRATEQPEDDSGDDD